MIRCACINDKDRPNDFPESKWVQRGKLYTLQFAIVVLPQRELGFQLEEIDLDESCYPYEYFLANRFGFLKDDLHKLSDFVKECSKINMSVKELMTKSNILTNKKTP